MAVGRHPKLGPTSGRTSPRWLPSARLVVHRQLNIQQLLDIVSAYDFVLSYSETRHSCLNFLIQLVFNVKSQIHEIMSQ